LKYLDKVTVIIPTFNSSEYVSCAINSIFECLDCNMDISVIVIDDNSNDVVVLEEKLDFYDRDKVRLIKNPQKTNASNNRQIAFDLCDSEFILFLDSDDLFLPGHIRNRISMHKDTNANFIFGNFFIDRCDRSSNLPEFSYQSVNDYIFISKGDIRTSTFSFFSVKGISVFDPRAEKHQDWIAANIIQRNNLKIDFDISNGVLIDTSRNHRMSYCLNIAASKYFVDNYLFSVRYRNQFSKSHWRLVIKNNDELSFKFFCSIYTPLTVIDFIKLLLFISIFKLFWKY
jgi:glycosyltransferase involved in cell wall biosynthesis